MKAILKFFIVGLAGSFGVGAFTARADLEVSAGVSIHATADFYAPLTPSGAWVEVGSYGRCWRPAGVAVDWRPYCVGHWVWTDCGWFWASDEPWGWACYHYGCWVHDPTYAWVWVPGVEWAPAWVNWRVGGGYIGWAPLGPRGVVVAAPLFVFVESARFSGPLRPSTVIVNNATIINKTTVINNVTRETRNIGGSGPRQVVVNQGPGLAEVQKASGGSIKPVPIHEAARLASPPAALSRGGGEVKGKDKPATAPAEQPKSAPAPNTPPTERKEPPAKSPPAAAPERNAPPTERRAPPAKSPPSGINKPPPSERPAPSPHSPPAPAKPSEGKGEDQGHEKEGGHHGKN